MKTILVIGWNEMTGYRFTGRIIRRDGEYREELETCNQAKACVWSSDLNRKADGETYAKANGYFLLELPDTSDVLNVARSIIASKVNP